MKPELDKKLCTRYPVIFQDRHGDPKNTAMVWGFECGDGWYKIIDHLCSLITAHQNSLVHNRTGDEEFNSILAQLKAGNSTPFDEYYKTFSPEYREQRKKQMLEEGPRELKEIFPIVAVQVKEKFGGLRFYIDGGDETVHSYINFAESLSYHTCEFCGSNQDIGQTTSGWITTMCKNCATTRNSLGQWKQYEDNDINEVQT